MRLAIIADTFPPLRMSGAVQMRDLVGEFAAQGHEPTVVVPCSTLGSEWEIEQNGAVTVLRVRTPPTKDVSYARRALAEMLLPYRLLRAMSKAGLSSRCWDGVVWYAPTIFLGPIAGRLRRRSRCRSYLILRDIFPEWVVDMGLMRRGPAYRFLKWIERRQYEVADVIGVQTEANLPYLDEWARGDGRRLEVLENWLSPAQSVGCSIDLSKTRLAGRQVFVYTGNMGIAQGMDVFLDMASRMQGRTDVGFLFVGRGSDAARFAARVEREALSNVLFHDEIDPKEIPGLLAQCHVGIVALDPRHKSHNIPGKFLTYMQAGLPVLARINPHNDLERMIKSERVGKVITGGDAAKLHALAEEMLADTDLMSGVGPRARAMWESRFSTSAAVKQITAALRGVSVPEAARPESTSVLLLNQFFYPDLSATAQHATDLARFLRRQGDSVTAIASRSIYGQAGSVLPREESVAGIHVHRVTGSKFGRRRIAFRAIDFLAFNLACLVKALSISRHQVTVCLTTPPYIAFVGLLLRWLKGSKFVFWTMDLYPDVPVAAGILRPGRTMHRLLDALDRFCLRHADEVVVLGRCMKARVVGKGVDPRRITVITPWADPGEICSPAGPREANLFRADWGLGDRFIIEYSGNCGIGHDFSSVCEAMVRLRGDDRVRWVFVGGGAMRPTLEQFITRESIGNAMLKPYQSRDRLSQLIGLGDVHLVLVADGFSGLLVPSKFYGVMAAGKPTIYVGPRDSEVARTIEETGCGICVENGDVDGVVAAVRRLREDRRLAADMGLRGRVALERSLSTAHACQAWRSLLLRLSATTA